MERSVGQDLAAVARISAVPAILQVISETTGMRFAAVARVTEDSWTACAVYDRLDFGLQAGSELGIATTLCKEVHLAHRPIIIGNVSEDPDYCGHHTPRMYGFQSYISVPVYRTDNTFFGTLCALDPLPRNLDTPTTLPMMESFARLLALQLEREETFSETEAALTDARATADLREQFIALLGHDLRNPLSAITSGSELLLRRSENPTINQIASQILSAALRASRLVDDVLDFARGRLGNGVPLAVSQCDDLHLTLRQVVAEIQAAHPDRSISAYIGALGSLRCDRDRLAQLLSNLLANAVAHGARTGRIEVVALREGDLLTVAVSNEGTPIPPERLQGLFQPFWRSSDEAPKSGLGLGLYIAAEIARSHGGAMQVESTEAAGTTFTFVMPLAPDQRN